MDKAILDTDILSELLRRKNQQLAKVAETYLAEHTRLTITVVTVMEVVKGLQQAQRAERLSEALAGMLEQEILVLDADAAAIAGRIYGDLVRTGRTIGRADPQIAGIALAHHLPLVTGNQQHYRRVQELGYQLQMVDWTP